MLEFSSAALRTLSPYHVIMSHMTGTHLTASFSRTAWVSWNQNGWTILVEPIWMLMLQEMMGSQWYQLDRMQSICATLQTDNHASTSSLNFLQARFSSCKALKAYWCHVWVNYSFSVRYDLSMPSVLWRCWLGSRETEWWGAGMVVCLEWGANDLHMVQLISLWPHHLLQH